MKKRLLGVAVSVAPLPALVLLVGLVGATGVSAASQTVERSPLFCSADFGPDGLVGRATLSSSRGSTYVHFSMPGKGESFSLRVGKRILGVLTFDVDRDGNTDVVALKTDLHVRVWLSDGHGRFVRRNQFGPGIARGTLIPADEREPVAICCSLVRDDGANLPPATRDLATDGPGPAGSQALESSDHAVEDASFTAIHPRGPPFLPLAW